MKPSMFLRDEGSRALRRHLIGLKVVFWGALVGGTLKSLDFPAWFVVSLLTFAGLLGTISAGVWSDLLPDLPDFGFARRGRERTLRTLVKLEEAIVLAEGGLQACMDSMRDTRRLPAGEGPLQRIRRANELVQEVTGAFRRDDRWRQGLEILSTGWGGIWRMLRAIAEAQRIGRLAQEAADLLKSVAGSQGGRGGPVPDASFRRRAEKVSRQLSESLVNVQQARQEASHEGANR